MKSITTNTIRSIFAIALATILFSSSALAEHFEYKVVPITLKVEELEALFNKLGAEGWELVLIEPQGVTAIFKRIVELRRIRPPAEIAH